MSVTATCGGLALTALTLLVKWRRALTVGIKGSLLVMSLYALLTVVLLALRATTAIKAARATNALMEEIIIV